MGREYSFNTSIETGTVPDPETPSADADLVTLGYLKDVTTLAVTAGAGVIITTDVWDQMVRVSGSGGAVTVTANPRIVAGTIDGQRLRLLGTSDSNTVTLDVGNGLEMNGYIIIKDNVMIEFTWDDTNSVWVELSRTER